MVRFGAQRLFLLGTILLLVMSPARADDEGTLRWRNGDEVPGVVVGATEQELDWVFEGTTLSLDWTALAGISFEREPTPFTPKDGLRVALRDGNVHFGELVAIEEDDIVLDSEAFGRMRLRRADLLRIDSLSPTAHLYLGPNGSEGWQALPKSKQSFTWRSGNEPGLTTTTRDAELFRDLSLPGAFELELTLRSSGEVPSFLLCLADKLDWIAGHQWNLGLETWKDELVLLSGETFEPVLTISKGRDELHLRLFWNQHAGRLVVTTPEGQVLAETKASAVQKPRTGFFLRNKGQCLTLDALAVSPWNGQLPTPDVSTETSLQLVDGELLFGKVAGFDPESGRLAIETEAGQRAVELGRVRSLRFSERRPSIGDEGATLRMTDGLSHHGRIISIRDGAVTLDCASAREDVRIPLERVTAIEMRHTRPDLTAPDRLTRNGRTLHGELVDDADGEAALGWRSVGSRSTWPLRLDQDARIRRANANATELDSQRFADLAYFRGGDVLPCRLLDLDASSIRLESPYGPPLEIELRHLSAIELATRRGALHRGFVGSDWKGQTGVEVTDDVAIFQEHGVLIHKSALEGNEMRFDLHWDSGSPFMLYVMLSPRTARRQDQTLVCMLQDEARWRLGTNVFNFNGEPAKSGVKHAKIRIRLRAQRVEVWVDGEQQLDEAFAAAESWGGPLQLQAQSIASWSMRRGVTHQLVPLRMTRFEVRRFEAAFGSRLHAGLREQVLTVPRQLEQRPPTHLLAGRNGDVVRGRLEKVTQDSVRFVSGFEVFDFPRDRIEGLLWLRPAEDLYEAPAPTSALARVLLADGSCILLDPASVRERQLLGRSPLLGPLSIPLDEIDELFLGDLALESDSEAYGDWSTRPAPQPDMAACAVPGAGGGDVQVGAGPLVGTLPGPFEMKLLDGEDFRSDAQAGMVIVLDFWATWCGPCVRAMPEIIRAVEGFESDAVTLIAVNQGETPELIRSFLERRQFDVEVGLDPSGDIGRRFQVQSIPHTVVLSPKGEIVWSHVGYSRTLHDDLQAVIRGLLEER